MGLFSTERLLRKGHAAWARGLIEFAVECLETVLARRPGAPEALFPLARAVAERGDAERALLLLEPLAGAPRSADGGGPGEVARVFRALILYDEARLGEARAELARTSPECVLGDALRELVSLSERRGEPEAGGPAPEVLLPRGALWLPDVAGRLLALLEERFLREGRTAAERFHHELFWPPPALPEASEREGGKAEDPGGGLQLPGGRRGARLWRARIQALCEAGRYREVRAACRDPRVEDSWRDLASDVASGFSLIACGEEGEAACSIALRLRVHAGKSDLHFLLGLAHALLGDRRRAGWSFARAARLSDTDVHHVIRRQARELGVALR
jgi:hypothetical protein